MFGIKGNWLILLILVICIAVAKRRRRNARQLICRKKRKGVKKVMPEELLKDFIGKECTIGLLDESSSRGTILALEGNWLKVEEKKKIRVINMDMIQDISTEKQG